MSVPPVQLLLYAFSADGRYEGRLAGALERMESGGALRILEALFVRHDPETGELTAVDLHSRGAGTWSCRWSASGSTQPSAAARPSAHSKDERLGETLRQLGAELAPGAAIAAVLVEHTWARALEDAVSQSGGRPRPATSSTPPPWGSSPLSCWRPQPDRLDNAEDKPRGDDALIY